MNRPHEYVDHRRQRRDPRVIGLLAVIAIATILYAGFNEHPYMPPETTIIDDRPTITPAEAAGKVETDRSLRNVIVSGHLILRDLTDLTHVEISNVEIIGDLVIALKLVPESLYYQEVKAADSSISDVKCRNLVLDIPSPGLLVIKN